MRRRRRFRGDPRVCMSCAARTLRVRAWQMTLRRSEHESTNCAGSGPGPLLHRESGFQNGELRAIEAMLMAQD